MRYVQEAPFCVQVELTEGCNLRCTFCGLNGIRGKDNDFKFLTPELAGQIAAGIAAAGWSPRVEFAMHGEPTKNPNMAEIVRRFREHLPRAYLLMETNGSGLLQDTEATVRGLFDAGLDCLAVDEYQGVPWAQRVRDVMAPEHASRDVVASGSHEESLWRYEYPACGPQGNPHQRRPGRRLVFIAPVDTASHGTHSSLSNHCGAGMPLDYSKEGKRCAKPFREISFRWDGAVTACCNDWRGEYVIGRVPENTPAELWQHPRMNAIRRYLYHGRREVGPCVGCNFVSYRTGLLPDKKGKARMGHPTNKDKEQVKLALADGPLAKPFLRPWEEQQQ